MKLKQRLLALALALATVAGCGAPNVVGSYQGELVYPGDQAKTERAGRTMQGSGGLALELKADHTFTLTLPFTCSGTWDQTRGSVRLTVDRFAGTSRTETSKDDPFSGVFEKPMVFEVTDGGRTLTAAEADRDSKARFVYRRVK